MTYYCRQQLLRMSCGNINYILPIDRQCTTALRVYLPSIQLYLQCIVFRSEWYVSIVCLISLFSLNQIIGIVITQHQVNLTLTLFKQIYILNSSISFTAFYCYIPRNFIYITHTDPCHYYYPSILVIHWVMKTCLSAFL